MTIQELNAQAVRLNNEADEAWEKYQAVKDPLLDDKLKALEAEFDQKRKALLEPQESLRSAWYTRHSAALAASALAAQMASEQSAAEVK